MASNRKALCVGINNFKNYLRQLYRDVSTMPTIWQHSTKNCWASKMTTSPF